MTEHYAQHAEQVSRAFLELLGDDARAQISDDQLQELAMLVEAAISTAVLEQLGHAADQVGALANQLRRHAENYDQAEG